MKRQHPSILGFVLRMLACLVAATPALFAGGSGTNGAGGPANSASGGDDVETVPIVQGETGSGFVLEGSWKDVRPLLREARGQGTVSLFRQADGSVQILYQGHFQLRVGQETLEGGSVKLAAFGKGVTVHRRNGDWIVRG